MINRISRVKVPPRINIVKQEYFMCRQFGFHLLTTGCRPTRKFPFSAQIMYIWLLFLNNFAVQALSIKRDRV